MIKFTLFVTLSFAANITFAQNPNKVSATEQPADKKSYVEKTNTALLNENNGTGEINTTSSPEKKAKTEIAQPASEKQNNAGFEKQPATKPEEK